MSFSHKENAKLLFSKDNIGTYWNDLYKKVDSCLDMHFVQRLESAVAHIVENTTPESQILDLGCGGGVLTEQLVRLGRQVVAADQSADMLEFSRTRLQPYDASRYQLVQTECEKLDFADASFDLVACIGVFGYIDDVERAIAEIRRVLKPGGILVMSIRNIDNRNIFDFKLMAKNIFVKAPCALYKRIRKLFIKPVQAPTSGSSFTDSPSAAGANTLARVFIYIFDRPADVIKLFVRRGFSLAAFDGLGYGPLQYDRTSVIPEFLGKKMSRGLDYLFRKTGLYQKTKWVADISMYVFKRD